MEEIQVKRKSKINWNDKDEVKKYQREMYHKNKPVKEIKEKNNIVDWKDLQARRDYAKKYYETHKEEITKLKQEKVVCPLCEKSVCKDSVLKHNESQIHKLALRLVNK